MARNLNLWNGTESTTAGFIHVIGFLNMYCVFLNWGILDSLVIFFLIIVCISEAFRCPNPDERLILLSTMNIYITEHLCYCNSIPKCSKKILGGSWLKILTSGIKLPPQIVCSGDGQVPMITVRWQIWGLRVVDCSKSFLENLNPLKIMMLNKGWLWDALLYVVIHLSCE